MKILISGQHISVGESLNSYIKDHIEKSVKKYFKQAINAHINLVKDKYFIRSEIIVNQGMGNTIIKSSAENEDVYRSFDLALEKIERQLNKYKDRMKNYHRKKGDKAELFEAKKYIIAPLSDIEDESDGGYPAIIAEKMTGIEKLSVADAVLRMDMLDLKVFAFINSSNDAVNVVYYRKDGNIAWLDIPQVNKI